jgi:homoserine kinase
VGSKYIPEAPDPNTAGVVAAELDAPARIEIDKGVRPSSGLGSSAASAAGAAVALDSLYDLGLSDAELVRVAAKGEAAVSGEAHADNVAPAVFGGFTIVTDDGITAVDTTIPLVVCLPDIVVSTRDAREVIPESVDLDAVVATVGSAATLTAGMFRQDPDLVGRGLQDGVVTPARADLIDGYDAVCQAARNAGATGVTVSGAGPAVLAVCHRGTRTRVASAMIDAFEAEGVDARAYQSRVGRGTTVHEDT